MLICFVALLSATALGYPQDKVLKRIARQESRSDHFQQEDRFIEVQPNDAINTEIRSRKTKTGGDGDSANHDVRREAPPFIPIIRFDKEQSLDGGYKTTWETGNNIFAEETGILKKFSGPHEHPEAVISHGSYSYTSPEGKLITVQYTADELGFRAFGDHLPTPPPIPEEIQKGLDVIYKGIREQEEHGHIEESHRPLPIENRFRGEGFHHTPIESRFVGENLHRALEHRNEEEFREIENHRFEEERRREHDRALEIEREREFERERDHERERELKRERERNREIELELERERERNRNSNRNRGGENRSNNNRNNNRNNRNDNYESNNRNDGRNNNRNNNRNNRNDNRNNRSENRNTRSQENRSTRREEGRNINFRNIELETHDEQHEGPRGF